MKIADLVDQVKLEIQEEKIDEKKDILKESLLELEEAEAVLANLRMKHGELLEEEV